MNIHENDGLFGRPKMYKVTLDFLIFMILGRP